MTSWWSPFNFSLPKFNPSFSIQKHFISFILKRCLGHLLRPGQLNIDQIDAQIGNGFVEVKNLELHEAAFNALLDDFPVQVQAGTIASVTVRIPWPNPLSSTVGLAVSGINITLLVSPHKPNFYRNVHANNPAASVASVAETFVHELSTEEESMLRSSVHPHIGSSEFFGPPGSLGNPMQQDYRPGDTPDNDPEGVSIFASLFERLLSRFEFMASEIRINLVHPDNAILTLYVSSIHYSTEVVEHDEETTAQQNNISLPTGESRTVRITGVKMTLHSITQITHTQNDPSRIDLSGPSSASVPEGSDSEMDEEVLMSMSQSLVSLSTQQVHAQNIPPSPSLSTISSASETSSMYQSALGSTFPSVQPRIPEVTKIKLSRVHDKPGQTILTVTDSIVFRITTPPPYTPSKTSNLYIPDTSLPNETHDSKVAKDVHHDKLKFEISLSIVAIAFHSRNISNILCLLRSLKWPDRHPQITNPQIANRYPGNLMDFRDGIECTLRAKGMVSLILGGSGDAIRQGHNFPTEQFFSRPLTPPRLPHGYVRFHVETIEANVQLPPHTLSSASRSQTSASLDISDLSILVFHTPGSPGLKNQNFHLISPVVITDPNLPFSYHDLRFASNHPRINAQAHFHPHSDEEKQMPLASFAVIDWINDRGRSKAPSPRTWRAKLAHGHTSSKRMSSGNAGHDMDPDIKRPESSNAMPSLPQKPKLAKDRQTSTRAYHKAISFVATMNGEDEATPEVSVRTVPFHFFLDLNTVETVMRFIQEAIPETQDYSPVSEVFASTGQDIGGKDASLHSVASGAEQPSKAFHREGDERKRLGRPILEELDSGVDYKQSDTHPKVSAGSANRKIVSDQQSTETVAKVEVSVPLIRVEVRVPTSHSRQARSGVLIVDLHSISFYSHPYLKLHQGLHFQENDDNEANFQDWFENSDQKQSFFFNVHRMVLAYAGIGETRAQAVLSSGPIKKLDIEGDREQVLLPFLLVKFSNHDNTELPVRPQNAVLLQVPSLHVAINKKLLDGLQLWLDDVSQWSERLLDKDGRNSEANTISSLSRNPSLIGSRYFIRRAGSTTCSDAASTISTGNGKNGTVIKLVLSKTFIRLEVPIGDASHTETTRYLECHTSDLNGLIEINSGQKDNTIVSLNITDVRVTEFSADGSHTLLTRSQHSVIKRQAPAVNLQFKSTTLPGTTAKESKVILACCGLTVALWSDIQWIKDVLHFIQAPPGTFESVIPSERTRISARIAECAVQVTPPSQPGALVVSLGDVSLSTELVSGSTDMILDGSIVEMTVLLIDDLHNVPSPVMPRPTTDAEYWMNMGYALLAVFQNFKVTMRRTDSEAVSRAIILIDSLILHVHLCADSISGITGFISDLASLLAHNVDNSVYVAKAPRRPTTIYDPASSVLLHSLDEQAFRRPPVIGPLPDLIYDDLPTNAEYLDASFGAAAGLRPLEDDDSEDAFHPEQAISIQSSGNITSRHGGETIKMLCPSISIIEDFYDTLQPGTLDYASEYGETSLRVRVVNCDVRLLLYDGYDWQRTKRIISEETKRVKRRLAKIRQLLANGQAYDPSEEEVATVLFNSVYVGLDQDAEDLERDALIAAIDEELNEDIDSGSESSWQTFKPDTKRNIVKNEPPLRTQKLDRTKGPSVEFIFSEMTIDFDRYQPNADLASRLLFTVRNLEILDHIRTSTWSKFLTEMRTDSHGNVRETDSNMVRVELQMLLPYQGHMEQEARLKAKLLPLRLHVDQDALDFLKRFFSFKGPDSPSAPSEDEIFFQHVEVFPVDIKLDYKPRRVDYRALKEGRTIELMNFFHFDGAEMTLRHITLKGITGWPRLFDTLNDLWTPDVKANQLVDVISGVSPIRSAVNVGSGMADLVLLPIAQYKKDGRIIRGVQKGTTAFVKSTAMEAIKLGARLATGTQVVLEQVESVFGDQFQGPITAEAIQVNTIADEFDSRNRGDGLVSDELISRYAEQPRNIKEGMQSAYDALSRNIKSAGQTILAVPMEVYERSGNEGPTRAVIRAVPIAVLKPMIGASEAISKTLFGLGGTLDPSTHQDTEVKYKHR